MKVLTVMNAVMDPELAEMIEQYACLSGFDTYCLEDRIFQGRKLTGDILYSDREGLAFYQETLYGLRQEGCPVVVIPRFPGEIPPAGKDSRYFAVHAAYPFTCRDFCTGMESFLPEKLLQRRSLSYGKLFIDREQRRILYREREIGLGPYEYEILLFLLEHIGVAVHRADLNRILPSRQRGSMRHIDSHIKNIRKMLNLHEVILSVRSIGYRLDPEKFYHWIRQKG